MLGNEARMLLPREMFGRLSQVRYERGFPTVEATTMRAIRRAASAPVAMRKGSWESW